MLSILLELSTIPGYQVASVRPYHHGVPKCPAVCKIILGHTPLCFSLEREGGREGRSCDPYLSLLALCMV